MEHIIFSVIALLALTICFFAGRLIKPNKRMVVNALGFFFGLCFLGPVLFAMVFLISVDYVSNFLWGDNNVAKLPIWPYLTLGMLFSPLMMAIEVFSQRRSKDKVDHKSP